MFIPEQPDPQKLVEGVQKLTQQIEEKIRELKALSSPPTSGQPVRFEHKYIQAPAYEVLIPRLNEESKEGWHTVAVLPGLGNLVGVLERSTPKAEQKTAEAGESNLERQRRQAGGKG